MCAHSNAAADELLQRVMDVGFCDGSGRTYRPDVVRIGSDDAPILPRAHAVWVDALVRYSNACILRRRGRPVNRLRHAMQGGCLHDAGARACVCVEAGVARAEIASVARQAIVADMQQASCRFKLLD